MADQLVSRLQRESPPMPLYGIALLDKHKTPLLRQHKVHEEEHRGEVMKKRKDKYPQTQILRVHRPGSAPSAAARAIVKSSARLQKRRDSNKVRINAPAVPLNPQKPPDIGNERWISHQTSAAIYQYKKDDEARAAEVWMMDQAKEFVRSQPVVPLSKEQKQQQMFGIVQTPQAFNNQFINKVGLSRQKLQKAGLSLETIERVYRALFVYSHGFHEMLSEVSNNCVEKEGEKIVTKLWEIFNALLERCEGKGYKTAIAQVQSDYTQQRETVIQSYEIRMNDMGVIQSKILSDLNNKTREWEQQCEHVAWEQEQVRLRDAQIEKLSTLNEKLNADLSEAIREEEVARKREGEAMTDVRKHLANIMTLRQELSEEEGKRRLVLAECHALRNERDDAKKQLKRVNAQFASVEMQCGTLRSQVEDGEAALKREVSQRTAESQRGDALQRQLLLSREHEHQSRQKKLEMEKTIKSLEERLELATLKEGKLQESLATTNHKLVTTLETKEALEIDLTTTQGKLESAHADIEHRDQALAEAASTRLQMETEMATLKAGAIELSDELGASKLSGDNLRQDLEVARSHLRDMVSAREDLKTRLAHKVQYGNDLVQQVKLMGDKIKKIEETNKMQAEKLKFEKADRQKLEGEVLQQLQTMEKRAAACEDEVKIARTNYDSRDSLGKKLKQEKNALESRISTVIEERDSVTDEKEAFRYKAVGMSKLLSLKEDMTDILISSIERFISLGLSLVQKCQVLPWEKLHVGQCDSELETPDHPQSEDSNFATDVLCELENNHPLTVEGFSPHNNSIQEHADVLKQMKSRILHRGRKSLENQMKLGSVLERMDKELLHVQRLLARQVAHEELSRDMHLKERNRGFVSRHAKNSLEQLSEVDSDDSSEEEDVMG